jgi:hypothetical protein
LKISACGFRGNVRSTFPRKPQVVPIAPLKVVGK